jgi:hypothetical protein
MSAKQFSSRGVMILLLSMSLVGGGCATTSSQSAQYKPHKPQMITGEEEREAALKLPDSVATFLNVLGALAAGGAPASW